RRPAGHGGLAHLPATRTRLTVSLASPATHRSAQPEPQGTQANAYGPPGTAMLVSLLALLTSMRVTLLPAWSADHSVAPPNSRPPGRAPTTTRARTSPVAGSILAASFLSASAAQMCAPSKASAAGWPPGA